MSRTGVLAVVFATACVVLTVRQVRQNRSYRYQRAVQLQGLALSEMEDGRFADAIAHLQSLARLLPDNILPPINLAICRWHNREIAPALAEVRRALRLDPDNPQALFTKVRILADLPDAEGLWRQTVQHFRQVHQNDARPLYLEALRYLQFGHESDALPLLVSALDLEPDNFVLMLELLTCAASAADVEVAADALDAVENRLGGFDERTGKYAKLIREAVERDDAPPLRGAGRRIKNLLKPGVLYQLGLDSLVGRRMPAPQLFPQLEFDPPLPKSAQGGRDIAIEFADATAASGLDALPPTGQVTDARVLTRDDFLTVGADAVHLVTFREGSFVAETVALDPPPTGRVYAFDVNQDTRNDLLTADAEHGIFVYAGTEGGGYEQGVEVLGPADCTGLADVVVLDVDHEGDLDLLVARADRTDLYLQNNGDGTWSEKTSDIGIAGPEADTTAVVSADFDDDGGLDLLVCHGAAGVRLYVNPRSGRLRDVTEAFGLNDIGDARGAVAADFNNDGVADLLLWGDAGARLMVNQDGSGFGEAPLPDELFAAKYRCVASGDYDNDGDQDVVVARDRPADGSTVIFARNTDGVLSVTDVGLPDLVVSALHTGDFDDDGDLDLIALDGDGAAHFWTNQGGNRNHWLRITLRGLNNENAKNTTQGLFARIEARTGSSFQALLGHGGVNHLGLGARRQADVLRVVWTNGLPQTWRLVTGDRTMNEEQVLKGSCPLLYTWNGERFVFVTDLMWKSPLGMIYDDGSAAPHQSARDFVKIAGESLVPTDGELRLQITEELWETIYLDRNHLLAVDHPADVEMVVDEKFSPPPYPTDAPIHWIGRRLLPVRAVDHRKHDVLDQITRRDAVHVDDLPLTKYQGLTRGHHLDLTFAHVPADGPVKLVLWGWIFPTDTTINFALSQNSRLAVRPPRLLLREGHDQWRTLEPFMGLPNGKRKCVVTDLTGRLPVGEVTLRIDTNMEVFWDAAALAIGAPEFAATMTALEPVHANLHYRGFSRLYRETPTGPHLFDYADVTTGSRFRDMIGWCTRYGPVTELLGEEDDCYVVMSAGDELAVTYDATALPPLPPGWRRDYVLYTDGWVKDADFHTAHSRTVEPLPYHGMTAYPGVPEHRYPDTAKHRDYLARYQTRHVSDRPFRNALKP